MADVVIDEWVLVRGLQAEQPTAGLEHESARLLWVLQERHRWVVTLDLVDVYLARLFEATYKGVLWHRVRLSLQGALVSTEATLWLDDVPTIEGPYHRKDCRWVSAAAAALAGCLLVTGDERLLNQLRSSDLPEKHGFVVCFVNEALQHLERDQSRGPAQ